MPSSVSLLEDSTMPPPSAFYCPISLELMTDPVTLSSGITYDRASIESWLSAGNLTCPVTRQPLLPHPLFTPNHTLLRIIRSWCNIHALGGNSLALSTLHPSAPPASVRIGKVCKKALFELGLLSIVGFDDKSGVSSLEAELIPREQATHLLISLISHHEADACRQEREAERICEEALSVLAILPLSFYDISSLADAYPNVLHYLAHIIISSAHSQSQLSSACLTLTKLISQHPSPKSFLRSLSLQFLANLTSSLVQLLKQCSLSSTTDLTQSILQSLCVLFKASGSILSSVATLPWAALVHAVMEQLLHAAPQGSTRAIPERALSLLEVLSTFEEGRAAIASHAFAVPTMASFLRRSSGDVALEAAVVVLWKVCRYSSGEKVRRQAMAACVPSKLVLLMQANQCSGRGRVKAARLVRLLIGGAKSSSSKQMNFIVHSHEL